MNNWEKQTLFNDLVAKYIVHTEVGTIELPVEKLMSFHEAAGLPPNEMSFISLRLPGTEEDIYNFILGSFSDEDATIQVDGVYFYDEETGDSAAIGYGEDFLRILKRYLANGQIYCNGEILVDQFGRAWIMASMSDDICISLVMTMSPGKMGVPIYTDDLSMSGRLWYDGKSFYYAPTAIYYTEGYLPSWSLPRPCAGALFCGKI